MNFEPHNSFCCRKLIEFRAFCGIRVAESVIKGMDKYMKFFKLSLITFAASAFLTGCGAAQIDETASTNPYPADVAESQINRDENQYWAKENLDLRAVGALLEKADDAEEFEYLLNSDEGGVNNLDLNGDGYVDYVSVREYEDEYDDQRGLSLFSRFGPNEIQEIATIIFNRDRLDSNGARVLLAGNEQIYGDNNYYETNWVERVVPIVSWLFNRNRDTNYESPYYNENYPDYYQTYQVVETPVYRTRVEQYYAQPVFIETSSPSITQIKIKSPYKDKSLDKIYSKLAKPTKEQVEFRKNNPNPPVFEKVKKEKKEKFEKIKDVSGKFDDQPKGNPNRFDKMEKRNNDKAFKQDKPNKMERGDFNQPKQAKFEKQIIKQQKQDDKSFKQKGGGDNPNKGGGKGNGKGNGGGKKN